MATETLEENHEFSLLFAEGYDEGGRQLGHALIESTVMTVLRAGVSKDVVVMAVSAGLERHRREV